MKTQHRKIGSVISHPFRMHLKGSSGIAQTKFRHKHWHWGVCHDLSKVTQYVPLQEREYLLFGS